MKKVTLTLDEKIAMWMRLHAAKCNVTVSQLIGEMLVQRMQGVEYERAMRAFFEKTPVKLRGSRKDRLPSRDSLHDRGTCR